MAHEYHDSISVKFDELPNLRPLLLKTQFESFLDRFKGASARRYFSLEQEWAVSIDNVKYNQNLNGTIIVPETTKDNGLRFDGASVPLPWLVSFLSFGILRPLGIMLTASLVHDFAFVHGGLSYRDSNDKENFQPLERDEADLLFKDMISTVNKMPIAAFVAWVFVRLGWFFVKYNGKRFGGKAPLLPSALFIVVLFILTTLILSIGLFNFIAAAALFYLIAYGLIAFYY